MSFEVFIQCHENGDFGRIPRQAVRNAFAEFIVAEESNCWKTIYGTCESCDVSFSTSTSGTEFIQSLCVHRPCSDIRLWDAMAAILRLGNVVLYFPADTPPLIANDAVKSHLPTDMLDALGEPVVVSNGKQILDVLHKS